MSDKARRSSRWVRPSKTTYAPSVIVVIVPEPWHDRIKLSGGNDMLTLRRVHVATVHRRDKNWSELEYRMFDSSDDLWTWLETKVPAGRRIHVFAPDVIQCVSLLGWWARLDEHGCEHETAKTLAKSKRGRRRRTPATPETPAVEVATGPKPRDERYYVRAIIEGSTASILRYRCNERSYLWANFNQYVTASEEQIAHSIGYAWGITCALDGSLPERQRVPSERCMMWCRWFAKLSRWWVMHDAGPWAATVAGCAMSYLKRRLVPETVLQHDSPHAAVLEEAAIYGGRRSVWYFGNVGSDETWKKHGLSAPTRSPYGYLEGPMVHHDIRSMYPWLLESRDYPVKLLTVRRAPSIAAVADCLAGYGVIATVDLDTHHAEYPSRTDKGIRYPQGRFTTTLAGPELGRAIKEGAVRNVHQAAVYTLGRPFRETASSLLRFREWYRADGEFAMEIWAKALANAMSGKMAQREHQWVARPKMAAKQRWGTWKDLDWETNIYSTFRALAGMVWERQSVDGKVRQMGAAYAYLTSYGRVMMRDVRDGCPPKTVLAQDTDGIWTLQSAVDALYRTKDRSSAASGDLRVTVETPCGRFWGPQHYWWGQAYVLSGHSTQIVKPGTDRAEVIVRSTGVMTATATPPAAVYERRIERDIGRIQEPGKIGDDGWLVPTYRWADWDAAKYEAMAADWYN